ncbi:unnamed protein product [Orchesella dallaii]|uniref:Uncharacterized protein n=1 Tax=Orchesella dallaii TaxID=48710 RepID=A0ABP1RE93_9HEXA
MHSNEKESSSQVGSWGRFARRIYMPNGNVRNQRHTETSGDSKDTMWLYVAISVVYFSLIGLVLLILIFAPKFRLPSIHENPEIENQIAAETQGQPQRETLNESKEIIVTENNFEASPRDPVYDIDPRSSIFRGDIYDDYRRPTDSRMRLNSRFRHV